MGSNKAFAKRNWNAKAVLVEEGVYRLKPANLVLLSYKICSPTMGGARGCTFPFCNWIKWTGEASPVSLQDPAVSFPCRSEMTVGTATINQDLWVHGDNRILGWQRPRGGTYERHRQCGYHDGQWTRSRNQGGLTCRNQHRVPSVVPSPRVLSVSAFIS